MAKEDIRWDVLQNERGPLDSVVLWCLLGLAGVLLAAGCEWFSYLCVFRLTLSAVTAAAGLALTTAPDVAHYLPFLAPLLSVKNAGDSIASGLATVLAPAVAAALFISLAVALINCG